MKRTRSSRGRVTRSLNMVAHHTRGRISTAHWALGGAPGERGSAAFTAGVGLGGMEATKRLLSYCKTPLLLGCVFTGMILINNFYHGRYEQKYV